MSASFPDGFCHTALRLMLTLSGVLLGAKVQSVGITYFHFSMHCNGSEAWQKILFNFFCFFRHFAIKGVTESLQSLSIYIAGSVWVSVFSVQNVRQTYQNIRNVHKTSWFLYRTFRLNLIMYRMFRNAFRCLDEKQRHLNLPLLFIINEVDKRVLLWYKLRRNRKHFL